MGVFYLTQKYTICTYYNTNLYIYTCPIIHATHTVLLKIVSPKHTQTETEEREVIKRRTTQSDDLLHTSIPSVLPCIKSIRLKQKDTETDTKTDTERQDTKHRETKTQNTERQRNRRRHRDRHRDKNREK